MALALALGSCQGEKAPAREAPPEVSVVELKAEPVTITELLPGRVAAYRVAEIRPHIGGLVRRQLFRQGSEVAAGDPLFQLDPAVFAAEKAMAAAVLQRAESVPPRAQLQVGRIEALLKTQAASQQAHDDALAARAQAAAEATLQEAQARRGALEARKAVQMRLLDRLRRAAKEQAVSPQSLDEAEAAMATLTGEWRGTVAMTALVTAKRDAARYEVERRQVRAALPGRVARRSVQPGDAVSATAMTDLFVMIPDTPRIVRAEIQENFVRLVKPGMVADIVSESDERIGTAGKVVRIGSFLDARRTGESGTERADVRVAKSILEIESPEALLIGQRVYVPSGILRAGRSRRKPAKRGRQAHRNAADRRHGVATKGRRDKPDQSSDNLSIC